MKNVICLGHFILIIHNFDFHETGKIEKKYLMIVLFTDPCQIVYFFISCTICIIWRICMFAILYKSNVKACHNLWRLSNHKCSKTLKLLLNKQRGQFNHSEDCEIYICTSSIDQSDITCWETIWYKSLMEIT